MSGYGLCRAYRYCGLTWANEEAASLLGEAVPHAAASARVDALPAAAIKFGTPLQPFVDTPAPTDLRGRQVNGFILNADVREKSASWFARPVSRE